VFVLDLADDLLEDVLSVTTPVEPPYSSTTWTGGISSVSYSSVISPTISSRMSSMVSRPAVPPYSSTAIAMW